MNCTDVRDDLSGYLDRELPLERQWRIEQHLRECADCARELAELREVVAAVADLPRVPVPADFAAGVREKLVAVQPEQSRIPWMARWKGPIQGVAVAAALLVVFQINRAMTRPEPEARVVRAERPPEFPVMEATSAPEMREHLQRNSEISLGALAEEAEGEVADGAREDLRKRRQQEEFARPGKPNADVPPAPGAAAAPETTSERGLKGGFVGGTKNKEAKELEKAVKDQKVAQELQDLTERAKKATASRTRKFEELEEKKSGIAEAEGSADDKRGGEEDKLKTDLESEEAVVLRDAPDSAPVPRPSADEEKDRVADRGGFDAGQAFGKVARVDRVEVYTSPSALQKASSEIEKRLRGLQAEVRVEAPAGGRRVVRVSVPRAEAERAMQVARQLQAEGLVQHRARAALRKIEDGHHETAQGESAGAGGAAAGTGGGAAAGGSFGARGAGGRLRGDENQTQDSLPKEGRKGDGAGKPAEGLAQGEKDDEEVPARTEAPGAKTVADADAGKSADGKAGTATDGAGATGGLVVAESAREESSKGQASEPPVAGADHNEAADPRSPDADDKPHGANEQIVAGEGRRTGGAKAGEANEAGEAGAAGYTGRPTAAEPAGGLGWAGAPADAQAGAVGPEKAGADKSPTAPAAPGGAPATNFKTGAPADDRVEILIILVSDAD